MKKDIWQKHIDHIEGKEIKKIDITGYGDNELSMIVNNNSHLYNLMILNPQNFLLAVLHMFKARKEQLQILINELEIQIGE
tara:strand:- start:426 stop:668 length:243 start_codon:yes stop_codon:yes gene_type:complete